MGTIKCPVCKADVEDSNYVCPECGWKFSNDALSADMKTRYEIDALIYSIFSIFFFFILIFQGFTMASIVSAINKRKNGGDVMITLVVWSIVNFVVSCVLTVALIAFLFCLGKFELDYHII